MSTEVKTKTQVCATCGDRLKGQYGAPGRAYCGKDCATNPYVVVSYDKSHLCYSGCDDCVVWGDHEACSAYRQYHGTKEEAERYGRTDGVAPKKPEPAKPEPAKPEEKKAPVQPTIDEDHCKTCGKELVGLYYPKRFRYCRNNCLTNPDPAKVVDATKKKPATEHPTTPTDGDGDVRACVIRPGDADYEDYYHE